MTITRAKLAIDSSGMKQIHIAKNINIDHTLLSMYLMGHRPLPLEVAKKIAKFLKVPLSNVLDEKVEEITIK